MKLFTTLLAIIIFNTCYGQFKEIRPLNKHNKIYVATGVNVEYIKSNKNEIIIETEKKEYADLLLTQIETNKLTIRFKPNSRVKTKSLSKITILSSYPLEEAKVSSSATLNIKDPIQATTFELEASSSGRLLVNQIKANKIDLDVSSSGKIEVSLITNKLEIEASSSGKAIISGNAEDVSIDMSSSSNINLNDTQIKNLEIDGSTSAKAYINTVVNLRSDLSTSAKVFYNKTPTNIIKNKTSTSGKLLQN